MGLKLGTRVSRLKGVSASKGGITPKVGRTWKSSAPSLDIDTLEQSHGFDEVKGNNLQDIAQVRPLRTDTEVVKHRITLGVLEFSAWALFLQSILNCVEVLVSATLEAKRTVRRRNDIYNCISKLCYPKRLQVTGDGPNGGEGSYLGASTRFVPSIRHDLLQRCLCLVGVVGAAIEGDDILPVLEDFLRR